MYTYIHTHTHNITYIEHCCPMPSRRLYESIKTYRKNQPNTSCKILRRWFFFHNRILLLLFLLLCYILVLYICTHIRRVRDKCIILSTSRCVDPYIRTYVYYIIILLCLLLSLLWLLLFFIIMYTNVEMYIGA